MTAFDFDLFVVGGGSGGVRAARVAASLGARVGLAEAKALGGTCVNVGCIPKKLLVYAAQVADEREDARGYGWTLGEDRFDWAALIRAKDREIARLNRVYGSLLDQREVKHIRAHATLTGPHSLHLSGDDGEREVTSHHILIATGARPKMPSIPGVELAVCSDAFFSLPSLPPRAVVLGGGFIGLELAGVLRRLGAQVDLVHLHDRLLNAFDAEVAEHVAAEYSRRGVTLHLGHVAQRIERGPAPGTRRVVLDSGATLEAELVLCAIGRAPNTEGLGLEQVGLTLGRWGELLIDDRYQTAVPSILAVGDVVGRAALTPVAIEEGIRVAHRLFGVPIAPLDYDAVPAAVFSQPPVAAVGLTEAEARRRGLRLRLFRSEFTPLKLTLSPRKERTLIKVVVDADTDRLLGVHMVGADAPEIVQGFAVLVQLGATKAQLDATVGIHPTAAEELVTLREPYHED